MFKSKLFSAPLLAILVLFGIKTLHAQNLFVVNNGTGSIGEYNAVTGAAINASFITGLNQPNCIAVSGNNLFVQNYGSSSIGEYSAATGEPINASFITGLNQPDAIAISGNNLFVANAGSDVIGEYNAVTGATNNASFITGLDDPEGIAIFGTNLFVGNGNGNTIGEYNATTGATINASFITGLNDPFGIAISGTNLFVGSSFGNTIGEYNVTTGATINASFITGLNNPTGIAIASPHESALFVWSAGAKGNWDTNSTNWLSGTNLAKVSFVSGNDALFTNAAAVTITNGVFNGGVFANDVTVSNNTGTVSFSKGILNANSLTLAGKGALTVNNSLVITNDIDVTTNGTLSLLNTNIASEVNISGGGKLILGNNLSLGQGSLSLNSGILSPNKTVTALPNTITLGTGGGTISNAATLTLSGEIGGSGGLNKTGKGSLTLSGSNSYSGGTLLSAGTLAGNASSLQGNITTDKGTTLVFNQIGSGAYSGDISGNGSVKILSLYNGVLNLSGTNTYTGGTLISSGLEGIVSGSTESIQGKITNNGAVGFNQAGSGTYSGAMSGTGALFIGSGTITLSGTNTYKGGTLVESGGEILGNIKAIQGNITNNGSVDFNQTNAGTYAGTMSGTGELIKTGAGTLTLSGTNNYSGGTLISAGGLSGSSLTIQGTITNNASLVFNQTKTGTYGGNLTGTGELTKSGSATLTLSGTNSYSGGTLVSAGTLAGTTTSLTGKITNNGTLLFSQSGSGTFTGSISGKGKLTDSGAGSVTLSGSNTFSGGTTITLGNLAASSLGSGALLIKPSNGSDASFSDTLSSGTLDLGALTLSGNSTIDLENPYTTIRSTNAAVTITGTNNFIDLSGAWTNIGTYPLVTGTKLAGSGLKSLELTGSFIGGDILSLGSDTNYAGLYYTFTNITNSIDVIVSSVKPAIVFNPEDLTLPTSGNPTGGEIDVQAVPEPSSYALFGVGIGALVMVMSRRRTGGNKRR